jgi:hypothetical protein
MSLLRVTHVTTAACGAIPHMGEKEELWPTAAEKESGRYVGVGGIQRCSMTCRASGLIGLAR